MSFNTNFYNAEHIEQLIKNLNKLQESIEQASTVFLKLGKEGYSQKLSQDWDTYFRYFHRPDQVDKRLCLLYLANDILQKCKAQGCEPFLDHLKPILIDVFKLIGTSGHEKLRKDAGYVLDIWRDRKIYSRETIKMMTNGLNNSTETLFEVPLKKIPSETLIEKQGESLPEDLIPIPQDLLTYIESVNNLKKWCEKTKETENKLSKILLNGEIPFNEDEANLNLIEYKRCLELQQKYRTSLLKSLIELIRQSDSDNAKYTHIMKKVITLMEELEKLRI